MHRVSSLTNPALLVGDLSDAGRSGKNNEDSYAIFEACQEESSDQVRYHPVMVVADGIGGNAGGETASRLAIDSFVDLLQARSNTPLPKRMVDALNEANTTIYAHSLANPTLQNMGTTLVAAALIDDKLYIVHAGDSRAYLIRNGRAQPLTIDHTWAQEAIEAGRLSPKEAREHPNRHVIKRFLGISEQVEADPLILDYNNKPLDLDQIYSWSKVEWIRTQPGDTILLCSDGLTDVVQDEEIGKVVARYPVKEAAQRLIDLANKAGGPDNITAVILQRKGAQTPIATTGGRSPLLGGLLIVAFLIMAVLAYFLFVRRDSQKPTPTEPTVTAISQAVAAQPDTPTTQPTGSDTPTPLPPTDTPTGEPSPTVTAEENSDDVKGAADIAGASATITETTSADTPATPMVEGSPTRKPTSTPVQFTATPTATDTPTVTDTPTATATYTPGPTRTHTPVPTVTPVATKAVAVAPSLSVQPPSAEISVKLLAPNDGDSISGKTEFRWQGDLPPAGFVYEVVFWKPGEDGMLNGQGWAGSTQGSSLSIDPINLGKQNGEYHWAVRLWDTSSNRPMKLVSEVRRIIVQAPSSGGGNGGGGSQPAPGCTGKCDSDG